MDAANGTRVGAFLLDVPIARGGMGAVWRAIHAEQGLIVALKVVRCDDWNRDAFTERFRDEVRAVAALDHPNIATILDHGAIDAEAAAGDGGLVVGSPWFAMEHAPGGTLAAWPRASFADCKRAWLQILDALAHAHARNVIHRDLKPGNVLLAGPAEQHPTLKLVDFGVAFARGDYDRTGPIDEAVVGTPQYMAPEQLQGLWRDYGPWTDLYAFGCLAWAQLCGTTPFAGRTAAEAMVGHLTRPIPKLAAQFAVPPELEEWIRALLAKDPARRFQRASDAAHALSAIGDAVAVVPSSVIPDYGDTAVWDRPTPPTPAPARLPAEPGEARRPRPAPMPMSWRREDPPPPPLPLIGAGLRLFGLRRVPLVGREAERDRLWELLGEVRRTGRTRLAIVHGPAGTGKSALVQWLVERAHELGAASWCKASFQPGLAQGEPLHRMGQQFLRTKGLKRAEVRERAVKFLSEHGAVALGPEADVLTELLHPAMPEDLAVGEQPVRLTRYREFYAGTRNTMVRQSSERPLIAWFDDVQWGIHGIGVASQVLRTQGEQPFPALIVLTVRDEALVPGSIEEDRLRKLRAMPETVDLRLGPLPRDAQAELVSRMLWLAPSLAAQVVERTAGNPLFAVQLVSAMVNRQALKLGSRGLELVPGASRELPPDVAAVWRSHLGRVLAEFPPQAEGYLELAAVLGTPVDRREWRRACDDPHGHFGDRFPGDEALRGHLVDRLIEERLASRAPQGWAFVHGMLEDALIAAAAAGGRLAEHHRAAAAVLSGRENEPAVAERLGLFRLAAGDPVGAVDPLLRGIEVRWAAGGAPSALGLLQRTSDAITALPAEDPRRGRLAVLVAALHLEQDDLVAARAAVDEAVGGAVRHGWPAWRAREVGAALALREGRVAEAEAELRAIAAADVPEARARGHKGLGQLFRKQQALPAAIDAFRTAAAAFLEVGDPADAAWCDLLRGRCHLALGDRAAASAAFEAAHTAFSAAGAGGGIADVLEGTARIYRSEGRDGEAEVTLRQALALHEALGATGQAHVDRLRLAVWLATDRHRDPGATTTAAAELQGLIERAARLETASLAVRDVLHEGARWASSAVRGDLVAWDAGFQAVAIGVPRIASPRNAVAAETIAWLGWIAAAALPAGETARAERALAAVQMVFHALGRPDLVDETKGWRPPESA
jgi:serine/threonine protein kinase/tetratricopeptide (TPR) repeat protein